MNRKWFSIAVLMIVAISLLSVSSCGHDQKLVSIQVICGGQVCTIAGGGTMPTN